MTITKPAHMVSMEAAIDLHDVRKTYRGKVHALRGVEMRVNRGEVFGLLGPNGAGKSTLVKIMMTVIRPSVCTGTVLGQRVGHKPTLARIGYLPEHHRFPEYLTARQVLGHFAAMSGLDRSQRRKRLPTLLDTVGLGAWGDKRVRGFSKGMRQRLGIASSLMHDPDLVILDEPTDGVDPVGRRDIRELLVRMRVEGRAVLLNSHLLSELEMVCDRVAILVQGKVVSQGTLDELTAPKRYYELTLAAASDVAAESFRKALPGSAFASAATAGADRLGLTTDATLGSDARPSIGPSTSNGADNTAAGGSTNAITPITGDRPTNHSLARRVLVRGQMPTGEWVELEQSTLRVGSTDPTIMQPIVDHVRVQGLTIRTLREVRPSLEDLFMSAVTDPTTGKALPPGAAGEQPKRESKHKHKDTKNDNRRPDPRSAGAKEGGR